MFFFDVCQTTQLHFVCFSIGLSLEFSQIRIDFVKDDFT